VVKHLIHLHMARRKERFERVWNLACDCAINPGIAGLPPAAVQPGRFRLPDGLAAEEYYEALRPRGACGGLEGSGYGEEREDLHGSTGAGGREVQNCADGLDTCDNHGAWRDADTTPLPLAEEVVRRMAVDAWRSSGGEVPEDIRSVVEGLLAASPIPWRQILRQFVAAAGRVGRTATWMRSHRRFGHDTPGIKKRQRLNLLVGIDVSDSTDLPELREAFALELLRIAKGIEARITVVYANSRIRRIERFTGSPQVVESFHGGGFTDLRPLFDHALGMKPPPAAVIYLTDGYGPAPEKMVFPTLWVLTKEAQRPVPWGVELRLDT
jgi:predicted metal-dependent peptidase